jgi:hypothetical protein
VEAVWLGSHQKKVQRLRAHLVFLDESGFLLIPNVRKTWAPRGETPLLWHRYRHDRISAISAVTVSAAERSPTKASLVSGPFLFPSSTQNQDSSSVPEAIAHRLSIRMATPPAGV